MRNITITDVNVLKILKMTKNIMCEVEISNTIIGSITK